jgi:AraC family transcriptional regulator
MSKARNSTAAEQQLKPGQFYGDVLNKYEADGLILSEFRHYRARRLPKHSHELAFFNLVLDGDYNESYGAATATLRPLTTLFHPSDTTHHDEIGPAGIRIFSVEMETRWLDRLREYGLTLDSSIELPGSELSWLATRLFREYREHQCCSALTIEGLVLEMLAFLGARKGPQEKLPPAWLSRVVELLDASFPENLTFEYLAAQVGVHPVHLSKVFRQFHHQAVGDYLHELRIRFACRQLADPDMSLAAIASAAGFSDQSHFTRVFKKFTGTTPGAFRTMLSPGYLSRGHRV